MFCVTLMHMASVNETMEIRKSLQDEMDYRYRLRFLTPLTLNYSRSISQKTHLPKLLSG